jgi:hypothetical protein
MNRYNELYARAQRIAESERQRLEVEVLKDRDDAAALMQSDSELLVLSSSLFNSMNAIESSQGVGEIQGTGQVETKLVLGVLGQGKLLIIEIHS